MLPGANIFKMRLVLSGYMRKVEDEELERIKRQKLEEMLE
jgi:hypothetical protein